MMCSVNELTAMLTKAAAGVGFGAAQATDIARAASWLAMHGHDGVGAALQCLGAPVPEEISASGSASTLVVAETCAGLAGAPAMELLVSQKWTELDMANVDAPLLLVGLAGVIATNHRVTFDLSFGSGCRASVSSSAVQLSEPLAAPTRASVTCTHGSPAAIPPSPQPVEVADDAWQRAGLLAARTYVPATEASRQSGAGAGLTDND